LSKEYYYDDPSRMLKEYKVQIGYLAWDKERVLMLIQTINE